MCLVSQLALERNPGTLLGLCQLPGCKREEGGFYILSGAHPVEPAVTVQLDPWREADTGQIAK